MNYSGKNVLHTYTKYDDYPNFVKNTQSNLEKQISALEAKEAEFYAFFNTSNFEDCANELRKIFDSNNADTQFLKQFQQDIISKKILEWKESYLSTKNLGNQWSFQLKLDRSDLLQAATRLNQSINNFQRQGVSIKNNNNIFDITVFGFDIVTVKDILNTALGTTYWGTSAKRSSSQSRKALQTAVDKNKGEYAFNTRYKTKIEKDIFEWSNNSTAKTFNVDYNDPFTYDAAKIRSANANPNSQDAQDINRGLVWIKDQIKSLTDYNSLSQAMKSAFEITWKDNVAPQIINNTLNYDNAAIFMKGNSSISSLGGRFGEFQTALLTNYIIEYYGKNNPKLMALIGSSLGGEQGRRDITVFQNLGIQVKNYAINSNRRIDTTQYLYDFEINQNFNNTGIYPIFRFLANYYFNRDYAYSAREQYNQLIDVLPSYMMDIANYDLNQDIDDKVSFYFIEGRALIPVSHIAKFAINQSDNKNLDTHVSTSFNNNNLDVGYSDYEYARLPLAGQNQSKNNLNYVGRGRNKQLRSAPIYTKYWLSTQDNWYPTVDNFSMFTTMLKRISIRTSINRYDLTHMDKYIIL